MNISVHVWYVCRRGVHAHVCGGQRLTLGLFLGHFHLYIEAGFSPSEPRVHLCLVTWPACSGNPCLCLWG